MKPIEHDKLRQLLSIIGPYPSTSVVHFSDGGTELSRALFDYCKQKNYAYQLNCTDKSFYADACELFSKSDGARVIDFGLNRPRYIIQGKMYEFVFVSIDLQEEQKGDFLKKAHEILRNAGNIVLFLPKISDNERYEWEKLLEQNYYVATNTIDDLFEHYDIVISKKMHGWGDR